jgi:hypothetical protein
METRKKINAQITITAAYTDSIVITVYDKDSATNFLQMVMTREQFVNATMNRLAHTEVGSAYFENVERVGKTLEMDTSIVEIPVYGDKESAAKITQEKCPEGWVPDLYFQSQESFFSKDGKNYARCNIKRWVEKENQRPSQRELND